MRFAARPTLRAIQAGWGVLHWKPYPVLAPIWAVIIWGSKILLPAALLHARVDILKGI